MAERINPIVGKKDMGEHLRARHPGAGVADATDPDGPKINVLEHNKEHLNRPHTFPAGKPRHVH